MAQQFVATEKRSSGQGTLWAAWWRICACAPRPMLLAPPRPHGPPLWLRPCPRQHRPCPQQRSHAASHAAARQRPPSRHQARQAGCQRCAPRKAIATCSSELRPPRAPPRRLRWHKKPCLVIPVPPIIHCPCFRHDSRAPPSSVRRKGRPAGAAVASQRRCELAAARVRLPRWQRAVRHS
jgi:hypothetical protein